MSTQRSRTKTALRGLARGLAAVFLVSVCLSLSACSAKDDEPAVSPLARTVATVDGWEVPYDLARGLFDAALAASPDDPATALAETEREIARMYAALSLLRDLGGDPFDQRTDRLADRLIETDIYGGVVDGVTIEGYGSVFAYLEEIGRRGMTYEAARLMARATVCRELLVERATAEAEADESDERRAAVRDFAAGASCLHFSWVRTEKTYSDEMNERLLRYMTEEVYPALSTADTHEQLLRLLSVSFNPSEDPADRRAGYYVTAATLRDGYAALGEILPGMSPWDVSPVIETQDAYCILVALPKDAETFERDYAALRALLAQDEVYRELDRLAASLAVVWSERPTGAP